MRGLLAGAAAALLSSCFWTGSRPMHVTFETTLGTLVVALDRERAPETVDNFVAYVRAGHYDGTVFHRVIPGFVVQGGGFDAQFNERRTRDPVKNESDNGLSNVYGTIAMARLPDPHSATAQFFFNLADNTRLDYGRVSPGPWGYAVFGRVTQGLDVLQRIAAERTGPAGPFSRDVPQSPIVIQRAQVTDAGE